jgi:predicted nuclease of predicted toxin-antitoxin system
MFLPVLHLRRTESIGFHNISFRLKHFLKDIYPDLKHVTDFGLSNSTDREILEFAVKSQLCIVSFDSDFIDLITLYKAKAKVIWLRTGNTTTKSLADILRANQTLIRDFLTTDDSLFLEIR